VKKSEESFHQESMVTIKSEKFKVKSREKKKIPAQPEKVIKLNYQVQYRSIHFNVHTHNSKIKLDCFNRSLSLQMEDNVSASLSRR